MARFLIDEDMPRSLTRVLRGANLDAFDVRDVGLRGHSDDEVLDYAKRNRCAVITADVEFGNIIRYPLGEHHGIIVARFPNQVSIKDMNDVVRFAILTLSDHDIGGNVISISPTQIRIRRHC